MELIIVAAVFFGGIYMLKKGLSGMRAEKARLETANGRATKASINDPEATWLDINFYNRDHLQSSKWSILPDCADLTVRGTSHRLNLCLDFVEKADPDTAFLTITRADHDGALTLEIYGHLSDAENKPIFLGYVPQEVAEDIEDTYADEMPLGARLSRAAIKKDRSAVSIRYNLVGPNKRTRAQFLI